MAGAIANCAFLGVAVGVGIIYGSLLISIGRNPSQRDELIRYAFIGFSLVEVSGLIGLVISLILLFGFTASVGAARLLYAEPSPLTNSIFGELGAPSLWGRSFIIFMLLFFILVLRI